jgi:hypothetical protein
MTTCIAHHKYTGVSSVGQAHTGYELLAPSRLQKAYLIISPAVFDGCFRVSCTLTRSEARIGHPCLAAADGGMLALDELPSFALDTGCVWGASWAFHQAGEAPQRLP